MSASRRWLVTGAGGQLGHHVVAQLHAAGEHVVGLTRAELDITHAEAIESALDEHRPDVVVNAAAYTAVDAAETDEPTALEVNGRGPGLLAQSLSERSAVLIHVSTDYVFDGRATVPYEPDMPTGPRTAYGRTKLAGERAVRAALPARAHVVRSAWVFGGPGPNFVDTMLRLERERPEIEVVADQVGSPTWAADLATALIALGCTDLPGRIWHCAGAGTASWHQLAAATFAMIGADPDRVRPITSEQFPQATPRPQWSVLSTRSWTSAGLSAPRPWREALTSCLATRPD